MITNAHEELRHEEPANEATRAGGVRSLQGVSANIDPFILFAVVAVVGLLFALSH